MRSSTQAANWEVTGTCFLAGDQVGPDEFARAAEQRDRREAHHGGGEQVAHGGMGLEGLEEYRPAQGARPSRCPTSGSAKEPPSASGGGRRCCRPASSRRQEPGKRRAGSSQTTSASRQQNGGDPLPLHPTSPICALNRVFSAL